MGVWISLLVILGSATLARADALPDFAGRLEAAALERTRHRVIYDGSYAAIAYPRRKGGTGFGGVDYVADGVSYWVEVGSDLTLWSSGHAAVEEHSVTDGDIRNGGNRPLFMRMVKNAFKKGLLCLSGDGSET